MKDTTKTFDPCSQFESLLNEVELAMIDVRSQIDRLVWLKEKIAEEYAAMERSTRDFGAFDEAAAAERLSVDKATLAHLRRKYRLPHFKIGQAAHYTPDHLRLIVERLEHNVNRQRPLQSRPLKKAA